jgi:hypothetical protein
MHSVPPEKLRCNKEWATLWQASCRNGNVDGKDVASSKEEKLFGFSDLDIGLESYSWLPEIDIDAVLQTECKKRCVRVKLSATLLTKNSAVRHPAWEDERMQFLECWVRGPHSSKGMNT